MRSRISSSSINCLALLIAAGVATTLFAQNSRYAPYPEPAAGYVTDHAGLLTQQQEERIEQMLLRVERQSGVEIIVVTVDSMQQYGGTANESVEAFATALFNRWGIGDAQRNDGILLLVAEQERKGRIELGRGYAPSRDSDAARVMSEVIVPRFREGDYAGGITAGVKGIVSEFTAVRVGVPWSLLGVVAAVLALLVVGISLLQNGKRGWGWVVIGLALVALSALLFVIIAILRSTPRNRSDRWASGGIGGFGGGSSRGGGATGSW